jgi:hypothetical protein
LKKLAPHGLGTSKICLEMIFEKNFFGGVITFFFPKMAYVYLAEEKRDHPITFFFPAKRATYHVLLTK